MLNSLDIVVWMLWRQSFWNINWLISSQLHSNVWNFKDTHMNSGYNVFTFFFNQRPFPLKHLLASSEFTATYNERKIILPLSPLCSCSQITHQPRAGSIILPVTTVYGNSQVVLICHLAMLITSEACRLFPFFPLLALSLIPEVSAWNQEPFNGKLINRILPVQKWLPGHGPCIEHQGIHVK